MTRRSLVLHSAVIVGGDVSVHSAIWIRDGQIAALGTRDEVVSRARALDRDFQQFDLAGACVTAGFVDAHVHLTSTGQMLQGLDLTRVRSGVELLAAVSRADRELSPGDTLVGHGWDETTFADRALPTRAEISAAAPGRDVYLTRVDVHSALVSDLLIQRISAVSDAAGYHSTGALTQSAHGLARSAVLETLSIKQRAALQRAALGAAARLGIVAVHENGGPVVSSADDLVCALSLGRDSALPEVLGFWGELHGAARARDLGAHSVGGDLFIDGSLGSHTAHLCRDYDDAAHTGASYVSQEELTSHFLDCLRMAMPGGVHAIGDAAVESALAAIDQAELMNMDLGTRRGTSADSVTAPASINPAQWRIEHCEMPSATAIERAARWSVIASVQPVFDALWGAPGGMYEQRLGRARARGMNPYRSFAQAGIQLAFGSDSPVTALGPWRAVAAAVEHHQQTQRLDIETAFVAHTSSAAAAARGGTVRSLLAVGAPADIAIWASPQEVTAGGRVKGSDVLSALAQAARAEALATMRAGTLLHDTGVFA